MMFKHVMDRVWAFDCEWVPDPLAGRLLYPEVADETDDAKVMEAMWRHGGADEENPRPFLKMATCRVVSIAAVERRVLPAGGGVKLQLISLPHDVSDREQCAERLVVGKFLGAVGREQPQLVGYNSIGADLKILVQRGLIIGEPAPAFCKRPNKPWEGVDYFARGSDHNIDIQDAVSGFGRGTPSLHELAVQSGIPGKMDVAGDGVAELWLAGDMERIVAYNETDALTTYLVWLRLAWFGGHFSDTKYEAEQLRVRELIQTEAASPARAHLLGFLTEWDRLQALIAVRD
ncbi:MAG: 3'-5' exonuclease [Deltaproteobacteria bacterium]